MTILLTYIITKLNIGKNLQLELINSQSRCLLLILSIVCILFLSSGIVFSAQRNSFQPTNKTKDLKQNHLLYLPLDERFTTRDLFLSFAKITPFHVITPDKTILPQKKKSPDMKNIVGWTEGAAGKSQAAIISADMLLYGGLIASRISNDSLDEIRSRLKILESIRHRNRLMKIFVSTTIMRMPAYSLAEEEPDYYADYGRAIFLFSYYSHRYEVSNNAKDKAVAESNKNQIPKHVLEDYLKRRQRNFTINKELINLVKKNVINRLVITLDDNAEYGLFKKEASELEQLANSFKNRIAIYPGADEAQLPLLSMLTLGNERISVYPAYRFPESRKLIPSFEGQPLEKSVEQQIQAAGGKIVNNTEEADCILYVNNFPDKQTFPPKRETSIENGEPLEIWLERAGIKSADKKLLIIADNRFYNGADTQLIASIFASKLAPEQIAYAGWNTSGNTLGSAVALGMLRQKIKKRKELFQEYKKLLFIRFIEDWVYMTEGREQVRNAMRERNLTDFAGTEVEKEYESQMKALFNSRSKRINSFLKTNFIVERVFFPWHRPFEVGLEVGCIHC
ncbi:MAG: DUF4127 family protein [Acidobacteriota bacterium]|nr:DUF4127 family protein [Acidobacteriota bacterium]